jgi:pimeloyl-ACP methyl ester carboxylesterase
MIEDYLTVRGARVHYFRQGSGAPLLYLHGTAGTAVRWLPFHEALAEHFDLIAPDHLGFGQSERPEWLEGVDDLVLHYVDLLDVLGLERVNVVGTSFGGWIAAALALIAGHRIEKLVLVDALGLHVDGASPRDLFMLGADESLRLAVHDPVLAEQLLSQRPDEETVKQQLKAQATLALVAWQPLLHDPKLARRLDRIRAPTLVVWGEQDRLVPPAHGEAYASGIPGARLELIPECGHLPHLERADVLVRCVRAFLEKP